MSGDVARGAAFVLVLSCTYHVTLGYSTFRDDIPNGHNVPHPCMPDATDIKWRGVGHLVMAGGGDRNPFGRDFHLAGKSWTQELCRKDSDHDGKTNGEELGDPNCQWSKGSSLAQGTISHPGVCEPLDSANCKARNAPFRQICDGIEFVCPAIQEPGVVAHPVKMPDTPVPARETTYTCMMFEFPDDKEYHMVAFLEDIVNINVMHHIVVYGCRDGATNTNPLKQPYNCFMSGGDGCETFLGVWALGQHGYCFHPTVGLKVGMNGFKRAVMEVHWNNPEKVSTYTDSSGVVFYLTPNLRQHDAGIFYIGDLALEIPPKEEMYSQRGVCKGDCTSQRITGTVNVVSVFNHMHYLGQRIISSVVTSDSRVQYLGYDDVYNYDKPVTHQFLEPKQIHPGDRLEVECFFNSKGRNQTTYYGAGTRDEMCFAFMVYYPKENIIDNSCLSELGIDDCEEDSGMVRGCDVEEFYNPINQENIQRYVDLSENCAIGYCKKECIDVVKRVRKHPCLRGEMFHYMLRHFEYQVDELLIAQRMLGFLTSCDKRIYKEEMESKMVDTSSAPYSYRCGWAVGILTVMHLLY